MGRTNEGRKTAALRATRRKRVASLVIRGMSLDEIKEALAGPEDKAGLRNPRTGNPYSRATIYKDIVALKERALASASKDASEHRARQLLIVDEVMTTAWRRGDYKSVLSALDRYIRLTGTTEADVVFRHKVDEVKGTFSLALDMGNLPTSVLRAIVELKDGEVNAERLAREFGDAAASGEA